MAAIVILGLATAAHRLRRCFNSLLVARWRMGGVLSGNTLKKSHFQRALNHRQCRQPFGGATWAPVTSSYSPSVRRGCHEGILQWRTVTQVSSGKEVIFGLDFFTTATTLFVNPAPATICGISQERHSSCAHAFPSKDLSHCASLGTSCSCKMQCCSQTVR